MKKNTLIMVALCLVCFATLQIAQIPDAFAKTVIRVKGSDDMAGRINAETKEFMLEHPDVAVMVSGGAKGTGVADLTEGNCEVVMAARDVTPEEKQTAREKGLDIAISLVGYGGVAFVTHPENPIEELTMDQVKKLIKGEFTNWKQVGGADEPVTIVSVEALNSDTRLFILNDFLGVSKVTAKVERVSYFGSVTKKVADTRGALGFCRLRDLENSPVPTKAIKLKKDSDSPAVPPSRATVADGTYPMKRPFYLCYSQKVAGDVKKYVDFIISKGWGQTPK